MNCWKERIAAASFLLLLPITAGGCTTICASPDLEAYNTYGGLWDRTLRHQGRVASVFAPAGVRAEGQIRSLDTDRGPLDESPRRDTLDQGSVDALPEPEEVRRDGEALGDESPETGDAPRQRPDLRDLELDDIAPRNDSGDARLELPEA